MTTRDIAAPPETVFPLLYGSRLETPPRCPVFRMGTPVPKACRIPDGPPVTGAARECVSDRGTIRQEVLVCEPSSRLVFRMVETDLLVGRLLAEVVESFVLTPCPRGTRLTRTTDVRGHGLGRVGMPLVYVGLKAVHRYVIADWAAQAARAAAA